MRSWFDQSDFATFGKRNLVERFQKYLSSIGEDRSVSIRLVGNKHILSLLAAMRSIGSKMRLCETSCQRERGKREIDYPRGCILSNCILCSRKPVVVSSFSIICTKLLQDVTPSGLHLMLEISLLFDISSMLSSKSYL